MARRVSSLPEAAGASFGAGGASSSLAAPGWRRPKGTELLLLLGQRKRRVCRRQAAVPAAGWTEW